MKIGLGLYRESLTPDNFRFARQAGATLVRSTRLYADDAEKYRLLEAELFVAVVGDVMDTLGLQHSTAANAFSARPRHLNVIERCAVSGSLVRLHP